MASSAPNPYGQAPEPGQVAHMHSYSDYNNQPLAQQQQQTTGQQQANNEVNPAIAYETSAPASQHHQQQRMNLIGGGSGEKPLVHHSNTSLANYESYISGMSSDSELTNSGTAARHHHHRPYSSQSRVYHAHPVPRNTPAPSRLSHYSSNSSANVHSASSSSSYQQQQQQQQHQLQQQHHRQQQQQLPLHNQSVSTTPPNKQAIGHQSSLASSGGSMSSGSSYMPAMMSQDSPISPIMMRHQQQQPMRQQTSGRQLPQRPFSQSMSIDQQHHSSPQTMMANHHYQHPPLASQSPAHDTQPSGGGGGGVPVPGSLHRNLTGDQLAGYQQKSYPGGMNSGQRVFEPPLAGHNYLNETLSQRNMRLEMDRVEMQAAALNLYDSNAGQVEQATARSIADLPPTGGPARSVSSSSGRHLAANMVGSAPSSGLHQHQQMIDAYNQNSQDPYTNHAQQHQRILPDWLPAASSVGNQASSGSGSGGGVMARPGSQFKQTMSIDHYPASRQQQRHFTAAKQGGQFSSTEQYHSLGHPPYVGGGHPAAAPTNQLASMGSNYDAANIQSSAMGPSGFVQHQDQNLKFHHYPPASSSSSLSNTEQHQSNYQTSASVDHGHAKTLADGAGLQRQHLTGRPKLQHQPSSSSSNSNLSGSIKSSHMESGSTNQPQDNQAAGSATTSAGSGGEHQKSSYPSASTSASHYHQSSQSQQQLHKLPPTGHHHPHPHQHASGRQDMLRRGHTSVAVASGSGGGGGGGGYSGGSDFGGSQSALSESGDLSMMQTSHSSHTGRRLRAASPSATLEASSSAGPHHHAGYSQHPHHHHHSTSSGHGIREGAGMRSESTTGLPNGSGAGSSTLTKKSNSATQLSMTGTKKRLGFRKKQVTSFSVHRSEEVAPLEARHLVKQGSSVSEGDSSMSGDSSSRSWSNSKQTPEDLASMSFIDGLGKGQMISRQGLASPYLGDIQLSLCDRRGNLEIEVIRARNLQAKTNKILPLTYVKLYLVKNRKCLAKAKTTLSNKRTLNPLFQQQLTFHEDYRGCILQSIVWGNFGKMDKKNFMGIAQISIDDLELSDTVISWYKLFLPSSLQTLPSKSLRHTLLSNSTESFTTTNNS